MDTLHVVICVLTGLILSVFMSGIITKPFMTENKTGMDWAKAVIAIVVLIVPAVGFFWFWGINVAGYVIGVVMTFLPYVTTPADREAEKQKEQEQQ